MNWETEEVINFLQNDEGSYLDTLDESAEWIEDYVRQNKAPQGLYESLSNEKTTLDGVNWDQVSEYCAG